MDTKIKDIRLFESDYQNINGMSLPSNFGARIYKNDIDKIIIRICRQFALKLREYDFCFLDFNHLYINCSTIIHHNEAYKSLRSKDSYHPWYRMIDYGLDKNLFVNLSNAEKMNKIVDIISDCLKFSVENEQTQKNVDEVAQKIKSYGEDLEIIYKEKNEKEIILKIIIKIKDDLTIDSYIDISYGLNSKQVKLAIFDLNILSQALGSILIGKEQITISPRKDTLERLDQIKIDL